MRYNKMGFRAFGNFSMFADRFSVVSIQYIARWLHGCNIIAGSFLYNCRNMNVKSICYYIRC